VRKFEFLRKLFGPADCPRDVPVSVVDVLVIPPHSQTNVIPYQNARGQDAVTAFYRVLEQVRSAEIGSSPPYDEWLTAMVNTLDDILARLVLLEAINKEKLRELACR
jgi:hypothetical protein